MLTDVMGHMGHMCDLGHMVTLDLGHMVTRDLGHMALVTWLIKKYGSAYVGAGKVQNDIL